MYYFAEKSVDLDGFTVIKVMAEHSDGSRTLVQYAVGDGTRTAHEVATEHARRLNEGHARSQRSEPQ